MILLRIELKYSLYFYLWRDSMKKLFLIWCVGIVACSGLYAQNYKQVSVKNAATIPADSLAAGSLVSPRIGDTVKITGVVTIPPVVNFPTDNRQILIAGGRNWSVFLRDTSDAVTDFSGILIVCDTNNSASLFNRMRVGNIVEITTVITSFPAGKLGVIQAATIPNTVVNFIDEGKILPPLPKVKISDFMLGAVPGDPQLTTGAKYCNSKVEFNDLTVASTSTNSAGRTTIILSDDAGNQMYLRDQSNYFRTDALKLANFVAPLVGQKITSLKGYITANSSSGQVIPFMISPGMLEDLVLDANSPPAIVNARRVLTDAFPKPTDAVPVSITLRPGKAALKYVQVKYSINGGAMTSLDAIKVTDTVYAAVIPAQPTGTLIRWKAEVSDVNNIVVKFPTADTAVFYYRVLDRAPTIKDVREQLTASGSSVYSGYYATVVGTVTADAGDIPNKPINAPRVYIQDSQDGYSGIFLNSTTPASKVRAFSRGDKISVRGVIRELNGTTMIDSIDNADAKLLAEPGTNYSPKLLTTSDYIGMRSGSPSVEQWENMYVEFKNVIVADTNADGTANFGEFTIVDSPLFGNPNEAAAKLRVETDDGVTKYATKPTDDKIVLQRGQVITSIKGIMIYSFGNYKLVPRKDDDVLLSAMNVEEIEAPLAGFAVAAYPNPMTLNGAIEVTFASPSSAAITIIDATGRRVASVPRMEFPAGAFRVHLDTTEMPSGVYTCIVENQNGTLQSTRMIIAK
jgi:hypothetical protein